MCSVNPVSFDTTFHYSTHDFDDYIQTEEAQANHTTIPMNEKHKQRLARLRHQVNKIKSQAWQEKANSSSADRYSTSSDKLKANEAHRLSFSQSQSSLYSSEADEKLDEEFNWSRQIQSNMPTRQTTTASAYDLEKRARVFTEMQDEQLMHHQYLFCVMSEGCNRPNFADLDDVIPDLNAKHEILENQLLEAIKTKYAKNNAIALGWSNEIFGDHPDVYPLQQFWDYVEEHNKEEATFCLLRRCQTHYLSCQEQVSELKKAAGLHLNSSSDNIEVVREQASALIKKLDKAFWRTPENAPFLEMMNQCKNAFIQQCIQSTYLDLLRLLSEYKLHAVSRFVKMMKCHVNFVEICLSIRQSLSTEEWLTFKQMASESLQKPKANVKYYRAIQGRHEDGPASDKCEQNAKVIAKKLAHVFTTMTKNDLQMQYAHTIPAPGIFSWKFSYEPIRPGDSAIYVSEFAKLKLLNNIFSLPPDGLKAGFEIELLRLTEAAPSRAQLINDLLFLSVQIPLVGCSETEHLFGFFNNLDHYSESKIAKKSNKGATLHLGPDAYKSLLAQGIIQMINAGESGRRIEYSHAIEAHTDYLNAVITTVRDALDHPPRYTSHVTRLMSIHGLNSILHAVQYCRNIQDQPRLAGSDLITERSATLINKPVVQPNPGYINALLV